MKELFKFVDCELSYDAYFYAPDGSQLIFMSFEKTVISRDVAFNLARNVFCDYY